jgi:hypothetical protein
MSITIEYRDNKITGVNFDEEAVQKNWGGGGGGWGGFGQILVLEPNFRSTWMTTDLEKKHAELFCFIG